MSDKVIIIAEAGVNHNGDYDKAVALVQAAAEAGADYVKFQTFKADKIVSKSAKKAAYQQQNINDGDDSQYAMLKKLEMPEAWHHQLADYAQTLGIAFLSTGFDEESIDFLATLHPTLYKIPSGEITNKPYLAHIAQKGIPTILSTGMADMVEIQQALDVLVENGLTTDIITVLHCNTEYPTPMEDVNLLAMYHIRDTLGVRIGYSDHTLGIEVPIAAVALGATVIEKHFTLDRTLPGPDHLASLEPDELKAMVMAIRNIEKAIAGSGVKEPSPSESKNIPLGRKSIHYTKNLMRGHVVSKNDFVMLRPGTGVSPMRIDDFVGRELVVDVTEGTLLGPDDYKA